MAGFPDPIIRRRKNPQRPNFTDTLWILALSRHKKMIRRTHRWNPSRLRLRPPEAACLCAKPPEQTSVPAMQEDVPPARLPASARRPPRGPDQTTAGGRVKDRVAAPKGLPWRDRPAASGDESEGGRAWRQIGRCRGSQRVESVSPRAVSGNVDTVAGAAAPPRPPPRRCRAVVPACRC